MFEGTDIILACPHCQALARLVIPQMEEFPDMVTWTDGWQTAEGMQRTPRVTRCPGCAHTYWVGEAEQIGFLSHSEDAPPERAEWASAPVLAELDADGVQQALAEGLGSFGDLELELRVLRWWRGNDEFRRADAPVGYSTSPEAIANMERLIEMTTNASEDLLLFRAEAQRHLGRFADMEETLTGVCCSDYWPARSRLMDLARTGSRRLDVLFLPLAVTDLAVEETGEPGPPSA